MKKIIFKEGYRPIFESDEDVKKRLKIKELGKLLDSKDDMKRGIIN